MENQFASKRLHSLSILVFCLFSGLSFADDLPWASNAEEVGMSAEQLSRINDIMQGHIDAGTIQGAVTGVARRGKDRHLETHGLMNVADGKLMQEDALFIMMSSTKPMGVAAMMLWEGSLVLSQVTSSGVANAGCCAARTRGWAISPPLPPSAEYRLVALSARLQCMTYSHIRRGSPQVA